MYFKYYFYAFHQRFLASQGYEITPFRDSSTFNDFDRLIALYFERFISMSVDLSSLAYAVPGSDHERINESLCKLKGVASTA